jgi:CRP-like cAMP-binding protein
MKGTTMSTADLSARLGRIDLFQGLSNKVLGKVADAGKVADFAPGADVVSAGESVSGFKAFSSTGVEMHVILSGEADVMINGETVASLGDGAYFGELSLIDGGPRSAGVVAGQAGLTTFAIPKWTFDELLTKHPEVAVPILRVLCGRLRRAEAAAD